MRYFHRFYFNLVFLLTISTAFGGINPKDASKHVSSSAAGYSWSERALQGFNMQLWLSSQLALGIEAWDPFRVPSGACGVGIGLSFPLGSCTEHLFGAAPMIAAKINGQRRVALGFSDAAAIMSFHIDPKDTIRSRIWQTSLDNVGEPNKKGFDDDGDGKIDEDELDGLDNDGDWNPLVDDVGADGIPDSLEVGCKGGYDPTLNPDPADDDYNPSAYDSCHPDLITGALHLKNNKDKYTEKNGIPDHGEPHVDEDYGAVSDNDFGVGVTDTAHVNSRSGYVPIGAKVWEKSYAWRDSSANPLIIMDYSFVDIGHNPWQDVYIAMLCDFDVGPVNVTNYFAHNYAAYDSSTRTAYVQNPLDKGSTPIGITLLDQSKPLDSLRFIFQWYGVGDLVPYSDSAAYGIVSGDDLNGQFVKPNQDPTTLADVRLYISIGPFQFQPADSAKATYAFVSGSSIEDLLNNARRAHWIYDSKYFIMPTATVTDSGGSSPLRISWNSVKKSPYGSVMSYRVYHGTASGAYTDSLSTNGRSVTFSGLKAGILHYFALKAVDDHGNPSALSDEVSATESAPSAFRLYDAFPNPFNPATTIRFDMPEASWVRLSVYDLLGRELEVLIDEKVSPGHFEYRWDASRFASGVYFFKMNAAISEGSLGRHYSAMKKLLLVK